MRLANVERVNDLTISVENLSYSIIMTFIASQFIFNDIFNQLFESIASAHVKRLAQ